MFHGFRISERFKIFVSRKCLVGRRNFCSASQLLSRKTNDDLDDFRLIFYVHQIQKMKSSHSDKIDSPFGIGLTVTLSEVMSRWYGGASPNSTYRGVG